MFFQSIFVLWENRGRLKTTLLLIPPREWKSKWESEQNYIMSSNYFIIYLQIMI